MRDRVHACAPFRESANAHAELRRIKCVLHVLIYLLRRRFGSPTRPAVCEVVVVEHDIWLVFASVCTRVHTHAHMQIAVFVFVNPK